MRVKKLAVLGALATTIALGAAPTASAQFFPSDCMESGGGRLVTLDGDPATFGGNADSTRTGSTLGHQVYVDHGPVAELRFRSLTMNAMVCNLDARTAEMTGQGQVSTAFAVDQIVQYKIEVFAPNNRTGSRDFYRITLSNGYDSGLRPVIGNINVIER